MTILLKDSFFLAIKFILNVSESSASENSKNFQLLISMNSQMRIVPLLRTTFGLNVCHKNWWSRVTCSTGDCIHQHPVILQQHARPHCSGLIETGKSGSNEMYSRLLFMVVMLQSHFWHFSTEEYTLFMLTVFPKKKLFW